MRPTLQSSLHLFQAMVAFEKLSWRPNVSLQTVQEFLGINYEGLLASSFVFFHVTRYTNLSILSLIS